MTDPRPEVVALGQALASRFRYGDPRMGDPSLATSDAEHILSALPAPFAIVDMDALRAALEALLSCVPVPRNPDAGPQWMRNRAAKVTAAVAEARRLLREG